MAFCWQSMKLIMKWGRNGTSSSYHQRFGPNHIWSVWVSFVDLNAVSHGVLGRRNCGKSRKSRKSSKCVLPDCGELWVQPPRWGLLIWMLLNEYLSERLKRAKGEICNEFFWRWVETLWFHWRCTCMYDWTVELISLIRTTWTLML